MDALVRFYEGEWVCLAKAEYGLQGTLVNVWGLWGSKKVPASAGMTFLRGNAVSSSESRLFGVMY